MGATAVRKQPHCVTLLLAAFACPQSSENAMFGSSNCEKTQQAG